MHCSKCGGEVDLEGWCINYCTSDDDPQAGGPFRACCGRGEQSRHHPDCEMRGKE